MSYSWLIIWEELIAMALTIWVVYENKGLIWRKLYENDWYFFLELEICMAIKVFYLPPYLLKFYIQSLANIFYMWWLCFSLALHSLLSPLQSDFCPKTAVARATKCQQHILTGGSQSAVSVAVNTVAHFFVETGSSDTTLIGFSSSFFLRTPKAPQ